jgi:hypothetical protein
MVRRSPTALDHLGNRAIDDSRRVNRKVHRKPQAPTTRRYQPTRHCLTNAVIVEFQRRKDRIGSLEQVSVDTKVSERPEVRAHDVPTNEKGPKLIP